MSVILCNASNRRNVRQSLESLHHERRVRGSAEYYVAEEIGAGVMSGSFRWHLLQMVKEDKMEMIQQIQEHNDKLKNEF